MEKTAVEWFMEQIGEKQPNGLYVIDTLEDVRNVFKQAKEIEKQQRQKDFKAGNDSACMDHENIEDYFNEYIKSK